MSNKLQSDLLFADFTKRIYFEDEQKEAPNKAWSLLSANHCCHPGRTEPFRTGFFGHRLFGSGQKQGPIQRHSSPSEHLHKSKVELLFVVFVELLELLGRLMF